MTHHSGAAIVPNRVSREEVAEVLNVSLSTVKRLLASGSCAPASRHAPGVHHRAGDSGCWAEQQG